MGHTVDSITLLGRAHKQISAERKERLKPVLNEDMRQGNYKFKISFWRESAGKHERS